MVLNLGCVFPSLCKEIPLKYNREHWARVSSCAPCFGRVSPLIGMWCVALALNKQVRTVSVLCSLCYAGRYRPHKQLRQLSWILVVSASAVLVNT